MSVKTKSVTFVYTSVSSSLIPKVIHFANIDMTNKTKPILLYSLLQVITKGEIKIATCLILPPMVLDSLL